jgi:hypothetical protein
VDLEHIRLGEPPEGRHVVDERIGVDPVLVLDVVPLHPVRGVVAEVLVEERLVIGAVDPAFARRRPILDERDQERGDSLEVLEHVGLGRAGLRIEHLVRVGESDAAPADDALIRGVRVRGHEPSTLPNPRERYPRAAHR